MSIVTATGIAIQSQPEIQAELEAEQRATIDPLVGSDPSNVLGQLNGILSSKDRERQEALQEIATAINPDNAEDALLDGVAAITGTTRNPPTRSTFKGSRKLTIFMQAGCTITAGVTKFAVTVQPSIVFSVIADARFDAAGDFTNDTGSNSFFLCSAECDEVGPIAVAAGNLTTILTPTTGLDSVNNTFDAILGKNRETDAELRIRRERELRAAGSATVAALKAQLEALENEDGSNPILSAVILENTSTTFDPVTGLPGKSFEAVIWDGTGLDASDDDVAEIIHANRPISVSSEGDTIGIAEDGSAEAFSRADQVVVTINNIGLYYSAGYVGDAAVKEAIAAEFQRRQQPRYLGESGIVQWSPYVAIVQGLPGVDSVVEIVWHLGAGPPVSNQKLTPEIRQIAVTDTSLITVSSLPTT